MAVVDAGDVVEVGVLEERGAVAVVPVSVPQRRRKARELRTGQT